MTMRILYVTNGFPYPLTSGYLRHYFLIRSLSASHAVTLLSLTSREPTADDRREVDRIVEASYVFPRTPRGGGAARRIVRRGGELLGHPEPAARALRDAVAELRRPRTFDVAVFSGKRTAPALAALAGLPVVADLCDATSLRVRGALAYARPARRLALLAEYANVRRIERRLVARASRLVFASARDRDAILGPAGTEPRGPHARAAVIPNGVDTAFWRRTSDRLGRDRIVFTGAMDYPPNVDAAVHLARDVLPLVRSKAPTACLVIVGRDPAPEVRALADLPGVEVTGLVPDVRPYLEAAAVFAAPLRFGVGIQNKVLEAMAMAVPVVASPLAADGVRQADGRPAPLDVASGPAETADRIVDRLRAAEAGATPDARGRAWVEAGFDWERSGRRLEALLVAAQREGSRW